MADVERLIPLHPIAARAHAPGRAACQVFLRRVSPRGAMVQGEGLAEPARGGVLILTGAGAPRPRLPRWRFAVLDAR